MFKFSSVLDYGLTSTVSLCVFVNVFWLLWKSVFLLQIEVTRVAHDAAKKSRQQWSIMWEGALHKSIAAKNRNVAMVNSSLKSYGSKILKEAEWNLD